MTRSPRSVEAGAPSHARRHRPAEALRERWEARWPDAVAAWSPFTRLRPPTWCLTAADERREGLSGSFAMIRLVDQSVVVSLGQVAAAGLADFPVEVLAHEVGHHVLCPADLRDNARMLARVRTSLPTVEHHAPMVANLYADLLVNDRLQRSRGLDMAGVYRAIDAGRDAAGLWRVYLRAYEVLWSLPRGTLVAPDVATPSVAGPAGAGDLATPAGGAHLPPSGEQAGRTEADAVLAARLVRSFAGRWLDGAGRFAALCLPYLLDELGSAALQPVRVWQDATSAGVGGVPDGLVELEADEAEPAVHPALDPELNDVVGSGPEPPTADTLPPRSGPGGGQYREPFEYGELLRATGLQLDDHEAACRYYRERALPHLVRFPTRAGPRTDEPLPEGVEPWDVGSPLADIDWTGTALQAPVVIPGVTTVRRVWADSPDREPDPVPVDLDLYVDSSGSMPDPQRTTSHLALAGAIVALSALRAGSRVQVTLWSGVHQFLSTPGFVTDGSQVLRVLTGYFGNGTAFPLHVLRDTYADRSPGDRPVHVMVISDDGVTTMFDRDERGTPGRDIARAALAAAGGGATMALQLWRDVGSVPELAQAVEDGWAVHTVRDWDELEAFARAFSGERYG